jgi:hypothetical protein
MPSHFHGDTVIHHIAASSCSITRLPGPEIAQGTQIRDGAARSSWRKKSRFVRVIHVGYNGRTTMVTAYEATVLFGSDMTPEIHTEVAVM